MRLFLRPCPFCHAEPFIWRQVFDTVGMWWMVECSSDELCDGLILCRVHTLSRPDPIDAAAMWNGMERDEYEEMCRELEA